MVKKKKKKLKRNKKKKNGFPGLKVSSFDNGDIWKQRKKVDGSIKNIKKIGQKGFLGRSYPDPKPKGGIPMWLEYSHHTAKTATLRAKFLAW